MKQIPVGESADVAAVSMGADYGCGVTQSGSLKCFGNYEGGPFPLLALYHLLAATVLCSFACFK